jgi:hypothetical protein
MWAGDEPLLLQNFCLFGRLWHLDDQNPEDCVALVNPAVRDLCGALNQHVLCAACPFIPYLDDAGAFERIEEDIDRRDVFFERLPGWSVMTTAIAWGDS